MLFLLSFFIERGGSPSRYYMGTLHGVVGDSGGLSLGGVFRSVLAGVWRGYGLFLYFWAWV